MLTKPDNDTLLALARLSRSAEWGLIEAWLNASREAAVQASLNADSVKARQAQGAFLTIDEILQKTKAAVEFATSR